MRVACGRDQKRWHNSGLSPGSRHRQRPGRPKGNGLGWEIRRPSCLPRRRDMGGGQSQCDRPGRERRVRHWAVARQQHRISTCLDLKWHCNVSGAHCAAQPQMTNGIHSRHATAAHRFPLQRIAPQRRLAVLGLDPFLYPASAISSFSIPISHKETTTLASCLISALADRVLLRPQAETPRLGNGSFTAHLSPARLRCRMPTEKPCFATPAKLGTGAAAN